MRDDSSLLQSYQRTIFRLTEVQPAIDIRIGAQCSPLDQLLDQHSARTWVFITAWNPGSKKLDTFENQQRQLALEAEAKQAGHVFYRGAGVPDAAGWDPEESILILGINREEAVKLGRTYEQLAIVVGERSGIAELVFIN